MRDYADMNIEELKEAYLEELEILKDQIPNGEKFSWLSTVANNEDIDYIKLRTMRGYLLGLRDCGKDIGDLKLLLELISLDRGRGKGI